MQYRREIDGLRALAVVPVVLFHAGYECFKGGFIGVDVFFVISGYLITSIIAAEITKGTFSLTGFYDRRIRRILPALLFLMIICIPFSLLLMVPSELREFSNSLITVPFFISNIFFFLQDDYFTTTTETKPLLHTWSLAVEEQYYIFFPIFMTIFWAVRKKVTTILVGVFAVVSLGLAEWAWRTLEFSSFYLTPMRVWELLIGVLIAFYMMENRLLNSRNLQLLPTIGMALIIYSIFSFDSSTPYPSVYTLIPTLGTALVILYGNSETYVGKLLSNKLFVGIGLISYSVYLWHQPIFAFSRLWIVDGLSGLHMFLLCSLSFVFAYVSWKYVEQPFRKEQKFTRKQIFLSALVVSSIVILTSIAMRYGIIKGQYDKQFNYINEAESTYGGEGYDFGVNIYGHTKSSPSFVLYGDSHALQYISALETFAKKNKISFLSITKSACLSLPGITNLWNNKVRDSCLVQLEILREKALANNLPIMIAHRWIKMLAKPEGKNIKATILDLEGQRLIFDSIDKLLEMKNYSNDIVIVGNVPTSNLLKEGGYKKCVFRRQGNCNENFEPKMGEAFSLISSFKEHSNKNRRIFFIDPYKALCPDSQCIVLDDDKLVYSDHAHLSKYGASLVIEDNRLLILSLN
ncbi:MAG: acyltransferase [Methylophaga sp.]|nr:MAG: acyltransferase [Methylophaga sp.]